MNKLLFITMVMIAFSSCKKENYVKGQESITEDFEGVSSTDELIGDTEEWRYLQLTNETNTITLDTMIVHAGNQSLKMSASPSIDGASKCDIANNDMAFYKGEVVHFTGWFYIEGDDPVPYLFLFDIEENAPIGAGPGIRIPLGQEEDIYIDRSKMQKSSIYQENPISFPHNQWVKLDVRLKLHQYKKGRIQIWQDDVLIIDAQDIQTMPRDFAVFVQGTRGIYNNIQVGITANSPDNPCTLYVDDVSVSIVP